MDIHRITIEPFGEDIYFSLATNYGYRVSKYNIYNDEFEINEFKITESNEIATFLRNKYNLKK